MLISELIKSLQTAQDQYGDLPVYTIDSDIGVIRIHPCRDGIKSYIDGVLQEPNEYVIELVPA